MKLILYHCSQHKIVKFNPYLTAADSVAVGNGGIPGTYFFSVLDRDDANQTMDEFAFSATKQYVRSPSGYMYRFCINDISRYKLLSMSKSTLTSEQITKINNELHITPDVSKLILSLHNSKLTDVQFIKWMIQTCGYDYLNVLIVLRKIAFGIRADNATFTNMIVFNPEIIEPEKVFEVRNSKLITQE